MSVLAGSPGVFVSEGADTFPPPAPVELGVTFIVPNVAALALINDTLYPTLSRARVQTLLDDFDLLKTSTLPLQANVVVATQSGVGRWVRKQIPHPFWQDQTAWELDPAAGNDENSGRPGFPLKTPDELSRRWGIDGLLAPGTVVVELLSSLADDDAARFSVRLRQIPQGSTAITNLCIKGRRALMASSALTGYTPLSRVTGATTRNVVTALFDFTPYIGDMIVLTSGPGAGYSAGIQEGAVNTATITPWALEHVSDTAAPPAALTIQPAGIVAGATFNIMRCPSWGLGPKLRVSGGGFGSLQSIVQIKNLKTPLQSLSANLGISCVIDSPDTTVNFYVIGCQMQASWAGVSAATRVQNCLVAGSIAGVGTSTRFAAGGSYPNPVGVFNLGFSVTSSSVVSFDGDFAFLCPLIVGGGSASIGCFPAAVRLGNVGFFVTSGGGLLDTLQINGNAFCEVRNGDYGSHIVYGTGPAYGIRSSRAVTYVATKPTINAGLGVGRETKIGGTDTLYALVPFVNPANGSMIVLAA